MAIQGLSGNQQMNAQQSLFGGRQASSNTSTAKSGSEGEGTGNVQLEASIQTMKSSMETEESTTLQLIESSQGVGQNVDTFA